MKEFILVTGGAGFIGSHVVDLLIKHNFSVIVFDNLTFQVHRGRKPLYLNKNAEYIWDDIRNSKKLKEILPKVSVIFHLASRVGVNQSNYQIKKYVDVNINGTANLLNCIKHTKNSIKKIIYTSSMTTYGEGLYFCNKCGNVRPKLRNELDIKQSGWDPVCPLCSGTITPIPIKEDDFLNCNSIYAVTKRTQEELLILFGKMNSITTLSFRLFNVYGPRQSLYNPYTGVISIFSHNILKDTNSTIFEDGKQTRDFIFVEDVANCLVQSLKTGNKTDIFNIGSGNSMQIFDIYKRTYAKLRNEKFIKNDVLSYIYRNNDIRHCIADISKVKKTLDWNPVVNFDLGFEKTMNWIFKNYEK